MFIVEEKKEKVKFNGSDLWLEALILYLYQVELNYCVLFILEFISCFITSIFSHGFSYDVVLINRYMRENIMIDKKPMGDIDFGVDQEQQLENLKLSYL